MALALAVSVNVEAQSFFEKVGKAVEKGVEKGVQRAAEKQAEKAVNQAIGGSNSSSKSNSNSNSSSKSNSNSNSSSNSSSSSNKTQTQNTTSSISSYECVDLGLPSGTKWATCNMGASSPEDAGSYFAWGEITTKYSYKEETSKMFGKEINDISGNSTYDAASARWGKGWRMPTKADFEELINNCRGQYILQGGVWGVKFTSKTNGNSIFLPTTGYKNDSALEQYNEKGYYWTSTPRSGFAHYGARFQLSKEGGKVDLDNWYVWFKNNCPLNGPLFDDFRFASRENGEVQFTIQIDCCWNNHKYCVYGRKNGFKEPLFECDKVKELVKWFNETW